MALGDVGRLIGGRYRVDRELFRGPGTLSLLVTDLRNGRPCVLRQLSVAAAPAEARRFEAQAAILARLDHPGLPRFVDGFSEGEGDAAVRVVVTSYHPGESLERLVAKGRPLTEPQALLLLRRIVPVLVYLHAFEPPLVHRTIGAKGIVIGPDGRPCLTDIDYAGAEQATPSLELAPPGPDELALAAPEVFMGGATPASDIYALGLTVCRGMTGRDPAVLLREGAKMQLRDALGASEAFATVLARMLEASEERRYTDAKALDADLARLAGVRMAPGRQALSRASEEPRASQEATVSRVLPQPPEPAAEEPRPRRSVRPLFLAGVALALVALAATAVRLRNQPAPATSLLVAPASQEQAAAPSPQPEAAPAASPPADAAPPSPTPSVAAPPAGAPGPAPSAAAAPSAPGAVEGAAVPAEPAVPPSPPATLPAAAPVAPADPAPAVAEGRLLFDGKPFANTAAPPPQFWFRREGAKTEVKPQVDYAAGAFTIRGLTPGRYAMSVRIDLEPGNPKTFPGDLTAWEEFTLEAGRPAVLEVGLRTLMHLVQPVDNGVVMPGWDAPCGAGNVHPGMVVFSWDPLGPGTRYDVSVDRLACGRGYESAGRAFAHSTDETWVKLDLPPSREGECYALRLTASRGGRTVGIMNTHGKTGIGWDYRFIVLK